MPNNQIDTRHLYGNEGEKTAGRFLVGEAKQKTPEDAIVRKLRFLVEEKNQLSPLDKLSAGPLSDEKVSTAIDRVISAERDPQTQKKVRPPGSESAKNLNKAKNAADFVQEFLKVGYQNMSDTQKDKYRTIARDAILRIYPDILKVWGNMSVNDQLKEMDRMLSDPEFAKHLKSILESIIDGAQEPKQIPQELLDRFNQKKTEFNLREKEVQSTEQDLNAIQDEYDSKYSSSTGSYTQDLQDLQVKEPQLIQEQTNAINALDRAKRTLDRLHSDFERARRIGNQNMMSQLNSEIAAQQKRMDRAQNQLDTVTRELDRLRALREDKRRLEEEIRRLERERDQRIIERDQAEIAYYTAWAEKNDFEEDIRRAEEQFIKDLETTLDKATEEWVKEQLQHYEEARDQLLREAGDQALIDGLQRRWNINRGRKFPEFDKRNIDADYAELIRNGPDEVILNTLIAGGMRREDAELKLAHDREFRERATREVVDRLLTRRLQTGKITEAEAMRIIDSPWGADAIQNAIEQKARYTGELDRLREAGVLDEGFIDKLKSLPHSKLLLILTLLFGTAIYGIGVGSLICLVGEGMRQVGKNYGVISRLF
jgi:uncharacterized coiled-coil protein SlyX